MKKEVNTYISVILTIILMVIGLLLMYRVMQKTSKSIIFEQNSSLNQTTLLESIDVK